MEFKVTTIDDEIHALTTIIESRLPSGRVSQGTGFFYHVLGEAVGDDEHARRIDSVWLVTNRHVLMPDEERPELVAFMLRTLLPSGGVEWLPITLNRGQLEERARIHADADVDVAATDVTAELFAAADGGATLAYAAVGEENFPGTDKLDVSVASDIIVVGYPKGYYDKVNKFPIVKAGIIASRWKAHFQGKPAFLIDAKLFPGSSGSIVVSKPTDYVIEGGQIFMSQSKNFCFLGIFSGEPYELATTPVETDDGLVYKKERFDLGLAWYYYLIPDIIAKGAGIKEGVTPHA
ncbi:MAG TPA: serine protease [Dehalococcoidia bacterium]|nr:serine protease [Dehalococcoidia bacterium]